MATAATASAGPIPTSSASQMVAESSRIDAELQMPVQDELKKTAVGIEAFRPDFTRPPGTQLIQIGASERVTALEVKYDMYAGEIAQLNRSRALFPGQWIFVKDPEATNYKGPGMFATADAMPRSSIADRLNKDGDEVDIDLIEVPKMCSQIVENFVNSTMCLLKVLYVTDGKGMVPGVLEANQDYVRFTPDAGAIVDEYGEVEYTLHFEHADLLQPVTQHDVPDPTPGPTAVCAGGAHHRTVISGDTPEARRHNATPQYLQLRVRLVYGQDPTPSTTAAYWFAIMPEWIDALFALLSKHCDLAAKESWEFVDAPKAPPDSEVQVNDLVASLDRSLTVTGSLLQKSELINLNDVQSLANFLPRRLQYADWALKYSSYEHGISLSTMYRKLRPNSGPCILIVRDSKRHVFGSFTTEMWHPADSYYGGGECFLFKLKPELRTYLWSGKNHYFMKGDETSMMIGGGTGVAGLWLDQEFKHGSSGVTTTFSNDCIASSPDFMVDGLEIWSFNDSDF